MRRAFIAGGFLILAAGSVLLMRSFLQAPEKRMGRDPLRVPIRLSFETPSPPQLKESVLVTLVVQADPKRWPAHVSGPAGKGRLEALLRLPVGVLLEGPGWRVYPSPENEKGDPSGPWSLFIQEELFAIPARVTENQVLARVPVFLAVVEEGANWVITARVRLSRGTETWETFGTLLATVQGDVAEFHTVPRKTDA